MTGSNSYTGPTTVNGGTLIAASANALGTSVATVNAGTLEVNNVSLTVNTVHLNGVANAAVLAGTGVASLAGAVVLDSGSASALSTLAANDAFTLTATINGPGSLTVSPYAASPLSSSNIYLNGSVGGTTRLGSLSTGTTGCAAANTCGQVNLGANITTTNNQVYNTIVNLSSNLSLTSTAGSITLNTVSGAGLSLITSAALGTTLNSNLSTLGSLTLGGATGGNKDTINAASITTSASQFYNDALTLGISAVTLTTTDATADLTLSALTIPANYTLNLNSGRSIFLNGAINTSSTKNGTLNLTAGSATNLITSGSFNLPNTNGVIAAVYVNNFNLKKGAWFQSNSALPAFAVNVNFQIDSGNLPSSNASFIRVKGGAGTSGDPYQLADIYGVQGIASTATTLGNSYSVANNIDASKTAAWNSGAGFISIGTTATPFSGNFNGNNFSLDQLYINTNSKTIGCGAAAS